MPSPRSRHGHQRQVDPQALVQPRQIALEDHLEDLNHGGYDADEADQGEEAQVDIAETGPGQGAFLEDIAMDQVVDRHRDRLDHQDGDAKAESRFDAFGNR